MSIFLALFSDSIWGEIFCFFDKDLLPNKSLTNSRYSISPVLFTSNKENNSINSSSLKLVIPIFLTVFKNVSVSLKPVLSKSKYLNALTRTVSSDVLP